MKKNTNNIDKYPDEDRIDSVIGFRRAHMKQMERIENAILALVEVTVEGAPQNRKKDLKYKIKDILDDGQLNGSVKED